MLVNFSVKNYKSFRDETVFSLLTTSKYQIDERHETSVGYRLHALKNAGIFGANASGKSNLIRAIATAKEMIVRGTLSDRDVTFIDDKAKPCEFLFVFTIGKEMYQYDFSFEISKPLGMVLIKSENILKLNNDGSINETIYSKENDVFSGNKDNALRVFFDAYKNVSDVLFLKYINTQEKVLLSNNVSRQLNSVFEFFLIDLIIIDSNQNNFSIVNDANIDIVTNFLKEYDTGIETAKFVPDSNFDLFKTFPFNFSSVLNKFISDANASNISVANDNDLVTITKTSAGYLDVKRLSIKHKNIIGRFTFKDESHGTKRMFYLIAALLSGNINEKVFLIDEIEKGCHPNLVTKLIKDFQLKNNNENAQLIFTTHQSSLMDDVLRKDEVYFIQKDNKGVSSIYSLIDFKDRTTNVSKRYLEGRFGATPNLGILYDGTSN